MTPLWMWACPTHWPVVPTGRILQSTITSEGDATNERASSLLDKHLADAAKLTEGVPVIIPQTIATRKSPDLRLSANTPGRVVYRRRTFNLWGLR